jgi:hypothetical protein
MKPRYTVAKPPRVHELARWVGLTSKEVLTDLRNYGVDVKSASSPVPLRYALFYVNRRFLTQHITFAGTLADGYGADCSCGWVTYVCFPDPGMHHAAYAALVHQSLYARSQS